MRAPCFVASMIVVMTAAFAAFTQEPRKDFYGDPLPDGVIMRLGSIRFRQRTKLFPSEVAFAPDCTTLAVTFSDDAGCGVLLLDLATGKIVRRLDVPGNVKLGEVIFSPDGKLLLAVGEHELFILETDKDSTFGRFFKRDGAWTYAILPDNKTLAAVGRGGVKDDGSVRLWDLHSGCEIGRLGDWDEAVLKGGTGKSWQPQKSILKVWISRDGKGLIGYSANLIYHWELPSRRLVSQRAVRKDINTVSENLKIGLLYDYSSDATVCQVWDLGSDKELFRFSGKESSCDLAPDGRVLLVTSKNMRLLEVPSRYCQILWMPSCFRRRFVPPHQQTVPRR